MTYMYNNDFSKDASHIFVTTKVYIISVIKCILYII